MTPDLKRLCEAAETGFTRATGRRPELTNEEVEAIVRAVLMELREVSNGTLDQGRFAGGYDAYRNDDNTTDILHAMLDHILSDPAEA